MSDKAYAVDHVRNFEARLVRDTREHSYFSVCSPRSTMRCVMRCVVSQQSFGVLDAAVLDDDILALAKTQSDRVAVRSAFKRVCVA